MATTGFWPVKDNLKDVIAYAGNPDKTTRPGCLDDDLRSVLSYAGKDEKTDQQLFVSGINCTPALAYEQMMATKRRFGKTGGNVAYHGYQSFLTNEVTPELAHKIGIETAKQLWGAEYEVVVTTHLNTDNLHNHIVLNSVSFKTGRKFENHISDHIQLRQVSDEICRTHHLSVLEHSSFYSKSRKEYWISKSGQLSRRDILRWDIDDAVKNAATPDEFKRHLMAKGYTFKRGTEYKHVSIIAPGWTRAIRLDNLGHQYAIETIHARLQENLTKNPLRYIPVNRLRSRPLTDLEYELRKVRRMDTLQALMYLFTQLLKMVIGESTPQKQAPLSPSMRSEAARLDRYTAEYKLLCVHDIQTIDELNAFIEVKHSSLSDMLALRTKVDGKIRRAKSEDDLLKWKQSRRGLSGEITKIRKEIRAAQNLLEDLPVIHRQIEIERGMEGNVPARNRELTIEK